MSIDEQSEDDLLWIRQGFLEYSEPHPHLIVHGHTPVDEVTHYGNRVNIDTGAAWGKTLSVVVIEGDSICVLEEDGRRILPHPSS